MAYFILYGVNTITDILYDRLSPLNCISVATTDGEGDYRGYPLLSLHEISKLDFESVDKIIICSMFVDEIFNSLSRVKFPVEKIYFYNTMKDVVSKCCDNLIDNICENDVLNVFFDLSRNAPTFDCVNFAIQADVYREMKGLKYISFFILSKRSETDGAFAIACGHNESEVKWRISHIVKPVFSSLSACISVSEIPYREMGYDLAGKMSNVFPESFELDKVGLALKANPLFEYRRSGIPLTRLKPHTSAATIVDDFISAMGWSEKKIVVITLRESKTHSHRNSNTSCWVDFAGRIDDENFRFIFVRDTSCSSLPLDLPSNAAVFPLAAIDFDVRIALYSCAYINMGLNCGTSYLYFFVENVSCLMYIPVTELHFSNNKKILESVGHVYPNSPLFRDNINQVSIWGDPNVSTIMKSFLRLHKQIELNVPQDFSDLHQELP